MRYSDRGGAGDNPETFSDVSLETFSDGSPETFSAVTPLPKKPTQTHPDVIFGGFLEGSFTPRSMGILSRVCDKVHFPPLKTPIPLPFPLPNSSRYSQNSPGDPPDRNKKIKQFL